MHVDVHVGNHVEGGGALDPTKLGPLLIGPGGALVALLLFIGYLLRELGGARKERDGYLGKYEMMREQRDEFRFLAGDAVRAGKRSAQTAVVVSRDREGEEQEDDARPNPRGRGRHRGSD